MEKDKCCSNGHYACKRCQKQLEMKGSSQMNAYNTNVSRDHSNYLKGGSWLKYVNGARVIVQPSNNMNKL